MCDVGFRSPPLYDLSLSVTAEDRGELQIQVTWSTLVTLVSNFSQLSVKIALKRNSPKCETENQFFETENY